jgi:hypothetical protein
MSHDDVERGIVQKACQEKIQKIRKKPKRRERQSGIEGQHKPS